MIVSRVGVRALRAGVVLAVLCAMAACATGPKRTEEQREADKATQQRVEAALDSDKALYAKHITVHVRNGVVHLSGYVWDPPDLDEAVLVAQLVPGVSKVVNNLELQLNGIDNAGVAR
jgi:osmotically-inducible protein OsmY